jgi:hypothetical protein
VRGRAGAPAGDARGGAVHVHGRGRGAAFAGHGHPGAVVDAVPLARPRRPGAPHAGRQSDARPGAGEAAAGAGGVERAQRRRAASPGGRPALGEPHRRRLGFVRRARLAGVDASRPLPRLDQRVLRLRLRRRHAPRAGRVARRSRPPAVRARGGALDADGQRRHDGDPRSVAARADRGARGAGLAPGAAGGDLRADRGARRQWRART